MWLLLLLTSNVNKEKRPASNKTEFHRVVRKEKLFTDNQTIEGITLSSISPHFIKR